MVIIGNVYPLLNHSTLMPRNKQGFRLHYVKVVISQGQIVYR